MTLVIMAAGMGSRFGGLKQIEPIGKNGEFILDYSIYDAIKCGMDKVVFIIKEENLDIFKKTIGNRIEDKVSVEYVFQKITDVPEGVIIPEERKKPWGTAHAILCCRDAVGDDDFVVINADDFYGRDAFKVLTEFLKENKKNGKGHYALVGYELNNTITKNGTVSRGLCLVDSNSYLKTLEERVVYEKDGEIITKDIEGNLKKVDKETTVSVNFWGFTKDIFELLEKNLVKFFNDNANNLDKAEYYITTDIQNHIEDGNCDVKVLNTTARWYGITYKEDKDKLIKAIDDMVNKGVYKENLWG